MANAILILYEFMFATLERMVLALAKRNSNHLINWQSNDRCKSAQKISTLQRKMLKIMA